jgi:hypothetical protein
MGLCIMLSDQMKAYEMQSGVRLVSDVFLKVETL